MEILNVIDGNHNFSSDYFNLDNTIHKINNDTNYTFLLYNKKIIGYVEFTYTSETVYQGYELKKFHGVHSYMYLELAYRGQGLGKILFREHIRFMLSLDPVELHEIYNIGELYLQSMYDSVMAEFGFIVAETSNIHDCINCIYISSG